MKLFTKLLIPALALLSQANVYANDFASNADAVEINSTVTEEKIADFALANRSSLVSVTIPDNVVSIGSGAFCNSNLSSLEIGRGLAEIKFGAFFGCRNLEAITIKVADPSKINVESLESLFCNSVYDSCVLYVPEESIAKYRTTVPWSYFSFIEGSDFGTASIESIDLNLPHDGAYYDLSGRKVENPTAGMYICNGKKVVVK